MVVLDMRYSPFDVWHTIETPEGNRSCGLGGVDFVKWAGAWYDGEQKSIEIPRLPQGGKRSAEEELVARR
jgi:hypothetical protein